MNREQMAGEALDAYAIASPAITFLRHNENLTFRVVDERTGDGYLLRIHAPLTTAFQGERLRPEGIVSELRWLEALADETELIVQRPVRARDGALVASIAGDQGDIACSLLHWIDGELFPENPLPEQAEHLGVVIATLHEHARRWPLPAAFARPTYDLAFHRRQINKLAEGVPAGVIREEDFALIQETLEAVLATLTVVQDALMLIHADLWRGNLLISDDGVHPIDFSLCGFGLPLFDLGTCLFGIPAPLRSRLIEAYRRKAALPTGYPRLIDACFMLSRMGAYVFLLADPDQHEWLKERIPRFVAQECRLFLAGEALLFGGPF